jgi:hypothetical protein
MTTKINSCVCLGKKPNDSVWITKPFCKFYRGIGNTCEKGKLVVISSGNKLCGSKKLD